MFFGGWGVGLPFWLRIGNKRVKLVVLQDEMYFNTVVLQCAGVKYSNLTDPQPAVSDFKESDMDKCVL